MNADFTLTVLVIFVTLLYGFLALASEVLNFNLKVMLILIGVSFLLEATENMLNIVYRMIEK